MTKTQFILFVRDQDSSAGFYRSVLDREPILHVPGMTEFPLSEDTKLGLMPESGIRKILGQLVADPATGQGIPRCELYIYVQSPSEHLLRALAAGARLIQVEKPMDWGDNVCYCVDPDGHVLAFAKKSAP
jgi:uncharacterized glyoxalase superfamily protein PhnB